MRLLLFSAWALLALLVAQPAHAQLAPPNDAGVTFGHVHLNVRDVETHKKLWVEHFGGTLVQKGPLVVVKLPNMLIALNKAEPTGGSEGTVIDHVGFKVRDLPGMLKGWRAAGYQVTQEFKGSEGFPNAYLIGPDDIKIELQEDTSLPVRAAGHHLHFILANHLKLRDWYVETFSAVPRKRGAIDSADVPGMNLSFATSATPTLGTKGRTVDHIGFEISNLEAFCRKLEARGMTFDPGHCEVPAVGLKIAFITDPSGVYIELTEGYNKY